LVNATDEDDDPTEQSLLLAAARVCRQPSDVVMFAASHDPLKVSRLRCNAQAGMIFNVPLEEVVDAFVRPLITRVEKSTLAQPLFLRLVGRIFASHSDSWPNEIEAKASVLIDRFTRSLGKALPTLPEEDLVWRLHFVVGAIIHMLLHGQTTQRLEPRVGGAPEMAATMEQLLSFAVAGLRGGVMSPDAGVAVPSGDAGDGHRPPLQDADQVLEDGHRPPLQDAEEPLPAKKRPKKAALNSPQVMFEF